MKKEKHKDVSMKKYILFLLFVCLVLLLLSSAVQASYTWSPASILSKESNGDSYRASVALDRSHRFHVAWKDNSNILNAGDDWDIFYTFKEHEKKWSEPELVSTTSINISNCLAIAVDSTDTVHCVWKDQTDIEGAGADWDIFYAYKKWQANWSSPQLLSTQSKGVCSCPSIAIDADDTIHVIWSDNTDLYQAGTDMDIYYTSKSTMGNWSTIALVTYTSQQDASDAILAIDHANMLHIVWYEARTPESRKDIFYTNRSIDGTWTIPYLISENCNGTSSDPNIVIDSNNTLHVVWNDYSNLFDNGADADIFYRTKPVGTSWQSIELLSQTSTSNCRWPSIGIDASDTLYVAWADQTAYNTKGSDYDIVLIYKTPNGSWSTVEVVTTESGNDSNWPRFSVEQDGTIHMTWWDRTDSQWITYYSMGIWNDTPQTTETPTYAIGIMFLFIVLVFIIKKRSIIN